MSRQGVWQGWEAEVQRLLPGASVLEQARVGTRWLALDETHQGHTATGARLGMLALRLIYRERAIPLAWVCYRLGAAPAPFPPLVAGLIALAFTSSHPSLASSSLSPDSETVGFSDREGEGAVGIQGMSALRAATIVLRTTSQPMPRGSPKGGAPW